MSSQSIEAADLFSVKSLVAVVTGGGTGIGLMIAQSLEANGAFVYITGRRKDVLDEAVLTAKYGNMYAIQGDITSKTDLSRAVAEIKSKHGFVNTVIANSGTTGPRVSYPPDASLTQYRETLLAVPADELVSTYDVNVVGSFNTVTAFLELLDEGNRRGNVPQKSQVIGVSSIAAYTRGNPRDFWYGASKGALQHVFKAFATQLVPYDIRANVIAPGPYPTEMTIGFLKGAEASGGLKREQFPAQRAGTIEDMGGIALFLVSKAGAYINGQVIVTDGGMLSVPPSL